MASIEESGYRNNMEFTLLDKTGVQDLISRANNMDSFLEYYVSIGLVIIIVIFILYVLYIIFIGIRKKRLGENLSGGTYGFANITISILTILTLIFTLFIQCKNTQFMIEAQDNNTKATKATEKKRNIIEMNNLYLKSLESNGGVKGMAPAIAFFDKLDLEIKQNSKISETSFKKFESIYGKYGTLAGLFFINIKPYALKYNVHRSCIQQYSDLTPFMSDPEEAYIYHCIASSLSREEQIIFLMLSLYESGNGETVSSRMLYNGYFFEAYRYFSSKPGLSKFLSSRSKEFSSYHAWIQMQSTKPGDFKSEIMGEIKEQEPDVYQDFMKSFWQREYIE